MRLLKLLLPVFLSLLTAYASAQTPSPSIWPLRLNTTPGLNATDAFNQILALVNSQAVTPPPNYTGVVATRSGLFDDQNNTSNHQLMARQWHIAKVGAGNYITAPQIVWDGWYAGETGFGASKSLTCSIEYPAGTYNQCTFSGSATGSIPSGALVPTDVIPLKVPIPDGALFWVRHWQSSTAGISYTYYADSVNDAMTFGASGVTDQTMGGTVTATTPGYGSFEYTIIGTTNQPSVCLIGDSRQDGKISDGTLLATGEYNGEMASSICPKFACLNLGVGGDTTVNFIASHTGRVALSQYCTHILDNYGVNDLAASESATTILTNQQTIAGYFPGKPFFLGTISPETTSSDSWATIANQTQALSNTPLQTYNTALRQSFATYPWVTGVFDIASVTESSIGTGKWNVSNPSGTANYWTKDGVHPTINGYQLIKNSGVVNTQLIHYP